MSARLSVKVAGVLCVLVGVLVFGSVPAFAAKEYAGVGSFGEEGSGNGQFKEPSGVAVDQSTEPLLQPAAGDVYVIDAGNQRVERFDSAGSYLSQWDGSATAAKSFSFSAVAESQGIAADSSTSVLDPSAGDVYVADVGNKVVDQFSSTGGFTGLELTGTCASPGTCPGKAIPFPGELRGIAVDPFGNLWVVESEKNFDEFSDTGAFVQSFNVNPERSVEPALAVDSSDNLYQVFGDTAAGKIEAGTEVAEFGGGVYSLAVVEGTSEVLLDKGESVERFGPVSENEQLPLEVFSLEVSAESKGIAINGSVATDTVYASLSRSDKVEILDYALFPTARTETASEATKATETLHGSIEAEGQPVSACRFEYGNTTSYGQSIPCEQSLETIDKGPGAVAVSARIPVQSAATYHYRLVATNANGTAHANDEAFSIYPLIKGEVIGKIASTEGTLSAEIDAGGEPTRYRVEYGTGGEFNDDTPEVNLGAPTGAVQVQVRLSGLQPGTEYQSRFVATNGPRTTLASSIAFTTIKPAAVTALTLPDNRAYELVSPPENEEVFMPATDQPELEGPGGYFLGQFARASADGNTVTYNAEAPAIGASGSNYAIQGGNQYLARRGGDGWAANDITPSTKGSQAQFEAASPDLSVFTFRANATFAAEPEPPADCDSQTNSYLHTSSGNQALVTESLSPLQCQVTGTAGISADGSHALLYTPDALTPQAVAGATGDNNLYDSFGGRLYQVNVLPDGNPETHPDALYGHQEIQDNAGNPPQFDFQGVVSPNASRIIWTDLNKKVTPEDPAGTTRLFVRENDVHPQSPLGPKGECSVSGDACTVQVDAVQGGAGTSGGGQFWLASSDGSQVLFTDESQLTARSNAGPGEPDLYEYDLDSGRLTDLTVAAGGSHADVQGVVGASKDGSYVYFVADGVLAQDANGQGKEAAAGQPNLYLSHDGATTFIVTLSVGDDNLYSGRNQEHEHGDWVVDPGERTAQVSQNGQAVVFMSRLPLTGYDSYGVGNQNEDLPEVFIYGAGTGQISCASCNPSGAPPVASTYSWEDEYSSYVPWVGNFSNDGATSPLRFINETGTQVFFLTNQPLVSQDTNSYQDVYEWEADGSGGCALAGGCVAPISSVSSPVAAFFVDASSSGDDVFFEQRASLAPQARDEVLKLYDARVNGGFPETSLACSGTGCQGVPPAPPIFATPSSVTFSGIGNFEAPVTEKKTTPKRKTAAQLRSEKLLRALRVCRQRHGHKSARRSACEKQARQRYGTAKKRGKR